MDSGSLVVPSPFGPLTLFADEGRIVALEFGQGIATPETPPVLARAAEQLAEYFAGKRQTFDLPLAPSGTAFQQQVWRAMQQIPYGQTRTYGDVAGDLDSAPRAVGGACGANPLPILIPCHRILGSAGLCGYSGLGGLDTKAELLRLEGAMP